MISKLKECFPITFCALDPDFGHRVSGIMNDSFSNDEFPKYYCLDRVGLNESDFQNVRKYKEDIKRYC